MHVDLVSTTTSDGSLVDGAYFDAPGGGPIDAMLWLHGGSMNFYSPMYLELGHTLSAGGIPVLSANHRGHDWVTWGASYAAGGFAFEFVSDMADDLAAWLGVLRARGHRRIVLGGHSAGAVGIIRAQVHSPADGVVGVVAASAPEYAYEVAEKQLGEQFSSAYATARRAAESGRGDDVFTPGVPLSAWYTHDVYVDTFHPDARNSVSALAPRLRTPVMFAYGSKDARLSTGAHNRLSNMEGLRQSVVVIDGADHNYRGRVTALADEILRWIHSI
jgi:pimeloyl-ACP methyl ester carboxylesterase